MYQYKQPTKPTFPLYAEYIYWGSFWLAQLLSDYPLWHALFSCLPLFIVVKLLLSRLVRGELGSTVICLSILAESIAHLFHQASHDDRFKTLYHFEHLICALFLAFANAIYIFEAKEKKYQEKRKKKQPHVQLIITMVPIILSGFYLMLYESQKEYSNQYIFYMRIFNAIPLTIQLVCAMFRFRTTSKQSFYFGFAAAIIYVIADLIQEKNHFLHKICHRVSIYLQIKQALTHIQWFSKHKWKLQ